MPANSNFPNSVKTSHSGDVVSLLVKEGDVVQPQQDVIEIETDKAVIPVPCSSRRQSRQDSRQAGPNGQSRRSAADAWKRRRRRRGGKPPAAPARPRRSAKHPQAAASQARAREDGSAESRQPAKAGSRRGCHNDCRPLAGRQGGNGRQRTSPREPPSEAARRRPTRLQRRRRRIADDLPPRRPLPPVRPCADWPANWASIWRASQEPVPTAGSRAKT